MSPDPIAAALSVLDDLGPVDDEGEPRPAVSRLERVGLGYRTSFPAAKVELSLSRIKENSEGLAGELCVKQTNGDFERPVTISTLNLKSLSARRTAARELTERVAGVPWSDLLDTFVLDVLAAHRRRIEVSYDDATDEDAAPKVLPHPLISPAVVFSPAGSGKTTLVLGLGVSMETRREIVPGFRPRLSAPGLYLDYETSLADFRATERAICRAAGIEPTRIGYVRMSGPLADHIEDVATIVSSNAIGWVIVDSVEAACGAGSDREGVNARVLRLHEALRLLECEVILIDHPAAADLDREGASNKPIGGYAKVMRARSMFELRAEREPEQGRIELAIIDTKRNRRRMEPTRGLAITFSDFDEYGTARSIGFERTDITAPELVKTQGKGQRILDHLKSHGAAHVKDIAEGTDMAQNEVRTYISRLNKGGHLVKLQDGRWAVKAR